MHIIVLSEHNISPYLVMHTFRYTLSKRDSTKMTTPKSYKFDRPILVEIELNTPIHTIHYQ